MRMLDQMLEGVGMVVIATYGGTFVLRAVRSWRAARRFIRETKQENLRRLQYGTWTDEDSRKLAAWQQMDATRPNPCRPGWQRKYPTHDEGGDE